MMTKHVEIWTLSKESRVVPYMTSSVEFFENYPPPDMYVMDGVFTDRVERRYMDIIQVTKCSAIYDRIGRNFNRSDYNRLDKYIAIHPDVEEAISVKWQEKMDDLIKEHIEESLALGVRLIKSEFKLTHFKRLPWYKRVWKAICNDI